MSASSMEPVTDHLDRMLKPLSDVPVQILHIQILRHKPALNYKWYERQTFNSGIAVLVVTVGQLARVSSRCIGTASKCT
ncbi:MAG: hypothetical protein JNL58_26975 [Planctomyces sp.]|nr:hypothetical protein [Planctomyces sp.]